jgi:VWFA-related protein
MASRIPLLAAVVVAMVATVAGRQPGSAQEAYRFTSGVELVNVTVTVSDSNGRFVPNLTQDDFIVYDDDARQAITHFSAERVPVSLGIALDTSGSMTGEKIEAARAALGRFLDTLLGPGDEIFLYRFADHPVLLQGWTNDRDLLSRAIGRTPPFGGTAMYDTIEEAVPMASAGRNQKKALVLISDGNDTLSRTTVGAVKQRIRESDVLVYAVGIDSDEADTFTRPQPPPTIFRPPPGRPVPPRFPGGPGRPPRGGFPIRPQVFGRAGARTPNDDHVNLGALRELTDDSGGRTEIVRSAIDLNPATASIADELSKQYYLAYAPPARKDGRWHTIRVELKAGAYRVRARRGYVAN